MFCIKLPSLHLRLSSLFLSKGGNRQWNQTTVKCCANTGANPAPPVIKKRKRHRKQYPGEAVGITEEMRFVAMRLRNMRGKYLHGSLDNIEDEVSSTSVVLKHEEVSNEEEIGSEEDETKTWIPSIDGFLKYLVNSKLVFETVERIIDQSDDVSYAYFRKTGLERSLGLEKDLEWLQSQGNIIPEAGGPGVCYASYIEELAEKSVPLFLCHFYNLYFTHIAGGQVITRQVSDKILDGRVLEFYTWDGNAEELLKDVREKLNLLGKHWTRDEKNRCLRESSKCFRYLGQLVRLIIQ